MTMKPTYEELEQRVNELGFENDKFKVDISDKRFLAKAFIVIGLPVIAWFGFNDFIDGQYFIVSLELCMLIVFIGLIITLYKELEERKEYIIYHICFTLFIVLFGTICIYAVGVEGKFSRTQWSYIFPILVFIFLGAKQGLLWVFIFYCGMAFLLFYSDFQPISLEELRARFLISFFLICIASFISEYLVRRNEEKLLSIQRELRKSEKLYREAYEKLRDEIKERKQAEEALQKAHDELELRVAKRTEKLRIRTHELDDRVRELNCFYGISRLLEKPHISSEKTLQGVVDLIPSSWQYPENTCVRLVFNGQEFKTKNFKESSWKQSADIKVHNDRIGALEVCHIKEKQEIHEGPFLKEESNLINSIAQRIGNILERFRAEEALIIRDKAIASSINGIALCGLEWNLTYLNESALKMWGYDGTEVLGKPVVDFWLRKKEAVKAMKILLDKGTWTGELIAKRKDGSLFDAQVFARLITDVKGKNVCVVSSFIDVTKEKILQDELIRSERLAASGGLAASIAHEINSPLQGIRSIISSIERKYKQDEGLSENLNLIKGGFTSIRDIVKRLLDLNRPGKEKKQPMNVNSVIEDTVSLLSSHFKKNKVKVNLSLSSKVPGITASPQQLGQLFLNLINNSVEAMAGISNERELIVKSNLRGKNIVIKVADTGPGIPKTAMKHIFDPFYTRKKKMGMGIGLSICHGIMEDHNGSIAVKNSPEGGAVFTITLPAR